MKITVLHSKDALEPPVDPLLDQLDAALTTNGHTIRRLAVDDAVQPLIDKLTKEQPELVFNLAESFRGKSALESNVAALLNRRDSHHEWVWELLDAFDILRIDFTLRAEIDAVRVYRP